MIASGFMPAIASADDASAAPDASAQVWWPTDGAHVSGAQPFKAIVAGMAVEDYDMTWNVDNGVEVPMATNYADYPHKEASVDASGWNWKGNGPYVITFTARKDGAVIATQSVTIYNDAPPMPAATLAAASATSSSSAPTISSDGATSSSSSDAPDAATTTTETVGASAAAASPAPAPTSASETPAHDAGAQVAVAQTVAASSTPQAATIAVPAAPETISVWWPTSLTDLSGVQPLKAVIGDLPVDSYAMYWQVDGGALNEMQSSSDQGNHKEASADMSSWKWNQGGSYSITFIAKDQSGTVIASTTVPVVVNAPAVSAVAVATTSSALQAAFAQPVTVVHAALSGLQLYVDSSHAPAATQAAAWRTSRPDDASKMDSLAGEPTAAWFGNWNLDIYNSVKSVVDAATQKGSVPVLVAYDIPDRDCGGYSSGGINSPDGYREWIGSFAQAIGSNKAIVILEPDALSNMSCLSSSDQATRTDLLSSAVNAFKNQPNATVYIDAGHSGWVDPAEMAKRLQAADVARADGFSLNVSNFQSTDNSVDYGEKISNLIGGKHFVIDTSRNGNGADSLGVWCNPSGRAIGALPTTNTGNPLIDAYLWIKTPGESDGSCNGGPSAGQWWGDYALQLVRNAR